MVKGLILQEMQVILLDIRVVINMDGDYKMFMCLVLYGEMCLGNGEYELTKWLINIWFISW